MLDIYVFSLSHTRAHTHAHTQKFDTYMARWQSNYAEGAVEDEAGLGAAAGSKGLIFKSYAGIDAAEGGSGEEEDVEEEEEDGEALIVHVLSVRGLPLVCTCVCMCVCVHVRVCVCMC